MIYMIGGGFLGWFLSIFKKAMVVTGAGGHPYPIPKNYGVPFAGGPSRPTWPVGPSENPRWGEVAYRDVNGGKHGNVGGRAFHASRKSRYHAGIDLYADAGDVVLAPESGVIVADQNFLKSIPGEDAMLIQGDSGTTILLGEIVAESMTTQYGLKEGSRVEQGQPVAIVAETVNGSHMLHFETYTQGSERNRSWKKSKKPHPSLLDPTAYLLRARVSTGLPFP